MSDDGLRRAKLQWESAIENMLIRPMMWSQTTEAYEDSVRVAFKAWEVMDRAAERKSGRSSLSFVWRHVCKEAHTEHALHYSGATARFSSIDLPMSEVADYLRRVWERLRDPIERLAALSEEED